MGTASIRPCYEADRFPAVFEDVAAAVGRCPPLTRKRLMVLVKANDRNRRHRSTTIAGCNLDDLGAIVPPPTRSRGRITLHTGAWEHDEAQARLLADQPNVAVVVHPEDTHRVALALQQQGQLLPLVRAAILDEARQGS